MTIVERAIRIIDTLPDGLSEKVKNLAYKELPAEYKGGKIARGCFRVTIIPDRAGFVIKTSRGENECCEIEKRISAEAKKAGLDKYFANYLGEFTHDGRKYFIFEKFPYLLADRPWGWENFSLPNVDRYPDEGYKGDTHNFLCRIKSDKIFMKLNAFIKEYHINDLHNWNVSYSRKRKHVVIIDYGSY